MSVRHLAAFIDERLAKMEKSVNAASKEAGVDIRNIYRAAESGKGEPTFKTLRKLASYFKMPVEDLQAILNGTPPHPPSASPAIDVPAIERLMGLREQLTTEIEANRAHGEELEAELRGLEKAIAAIEHPAAPTEFQPKRKSR